MPLILLLAAALILAGPAQAKAKPESKDVALVELFLKSPTAQLPPEEVDEFLAIDEKTLPKKLRERYEAKKTELETLRKIYKLQNNIPPSKSLDKDCAIVHPWTDLFMSLLKLVGFTEITKDEETWLMQNTRCREDEMQCRFSLTIVDKKITKKKLKRHYYLFCRALGDPNSPACDPLMVLLEFRRKGEAPDQNSGAFGESSFPTCH